MRWFTGTLLLGLAGCAATPRQAAEAQADAAASAAKLQTALAGLTPGEPTDCLPLSYRSVQTEAYGATILYKVSSRVIYRNDTAGGCESMGHGDYLVSVSNGGRVCRGDIGRTFQQGSSIPTGSCALGAFTPYTRHG